MDEEIGRRAGSSAPRHRTFGGNGALVPRFGDARDWWFQKRFGMFVHWGLYSIAGWHEQLEWRGGVPRAQYEKYFSQWNPKHYNPDAWLDLAQSAGMEYICFTTKHHEGFCQWDTKLTDFNVMNTPYGKDALRQLADACHRRNFPLCLYYSVADWHSPLYPNQGRTHELQPQPGDHPDLEKYVEFVRGPGARALHQLRQDQRILVGYVRRQDQGSLDQCHDSRTAAHRRHQQPRL